MFGLSTEDHREMRKGALRHYGRKYAFWIVFGPWLAKLLLWAGLIVLGWITWAKVPHAVLGATALAVAAGAALALLWPKLSGLGSRHRLMAAAARVRTPRLQLGWAYATLLFVGAGMGWLALWSPFS
jgi:hypothetical protein